MMGNKMNKSKVKLQLCMYIINLKLCTYTVRLIYKVMSIRKSHARNLHESHEYMQGYSPVMGTINNNVRSYSVAIDK